MTPRMRPVDLLVAAYNLVLAVVWLQLTGAAWYAPLCVLLHVVAAGLPLLLQRRRDRDPLRELYPLAALAVFWSELGALQALSTAPTWDPAISALDLALFGTHFNLVWMPAMPQLLVSEVMHFSYFAYYPLIALPPLAMYLSRRDEALRDMMLCLMVSYLACYLIYLILPVIGPAELLPHYDGALTAGWFYRLTHAARDAGDSLGTAFPSSHAAGATTIAVLAWRWFSPRLAGLLTLQAVAVLLATVYTQNHYPVDTLAGALLALTLQLGVLPTVLGVRRRPLIPVLPAAWSTP